GISRSELFIPEEQIVFRKVNGRPAALSHQHLFKFFLRTDEHMFFRKLHPQISCILTTVLGFKGGNRKQDRREYTILVFFLTGVQDKETQDKVICIFFNESYNRSCLTDRSFNFWKK